MFEPEGEDPILDTKALSEFVLFCIWAIREMCGCLFVYRQGFAAYTRLFLNLLCNPGWVQICSNPPNFRAF